MMEESVCVDTATPSDNSSGQPTSASQEQEQQLLPSSQDQDNHHTTSHDEYTRWILTASQKKAQREAKLQRKKRSTDTGAALAHTTAHSDNEKDGDNKVVLQDDNDSNWDGISNNIMGTTTNSLLTDGQCGSKPLQKSLQMFDPLNTSKDIVRDTELMEQQQQQPRRRHASVGGITTGGGRASQKPATAPTRLPTPKSSSVISSLPASTTRPRTTKRFSSLDGINSQRRRQQQQQRTTTNWLDLDSHESTVIPIVPRKQDTRRPVSMISSSVEKSSTGAWDTVDFKGKANQQLVDFDPFLAHDPLERKDAFKCAGETGVPCQTTTSAPKQPRPTINTRIPLPITKIPTLSSDEDEEATSTQQIDPPSSTTATKRLPSCNNKQQQQQQQETYYGDRIFRRPSLLRNDIIQEQLDKERQLSRCIDVDLVSVQGELCVPECISHPEQQLQHDTHHHHHHSSSSTSSVSSTSPISQPLQRRVSSLHERLQELVNDESVWNEITKTATTDMGDDPWSTEDRKLESSIKQPPQKQHTNATPGQPKRRTRPSFNTTRTIPVATSVTENTATLPSPNVSPSPLSIRPAMSPPTAFKLYQHQLSPFEQQEIMKYSQIFYVGNHAKNKYQATMDRSDNNYGYDDERGDYLFVPKDHLAYRYEVLETMGKGSFGQVVKAFDHKLGATVAVKLIRNKKRFHAQALIEVKTLENLLQWDPDDKHNNVRMTDYFYFRNHLCIAFECLSINLYDFIKNNHFQGSSMGLIRRFTIQLLNSLTILYQHHLIHCDLKPENILLKHPTKSTIKVIDFGSSCLENEKVYTYIQSRFYRAPEVILGLDYGVAIDMWSVGCILAELYTGYPLFPGENEHDQLACIMEVRGVPSRTLVEKCSRRKEFFDFYGNPKIMPNSKGKKRKPGTKSLSSILKCSDDKFVDFINQCLQWDQDDRIKPEEAFKHGWIARQPQ